MAAFRKKPIVIEAWQFTSLDAMRTAPAWVVAQDKRGSLSLFIKTLEGVMEALPGDWIILGVKGEIYPCKPDIFAATYERVEP